MICDLSFSSKMDPERMAHVKAALFSNGEKFLYFWILLNMAYPHP